MVAELAPLEHKLVALRRIICPPDLSIRTGVHPDTAFALAQILDYARGVGATNLERLVVERAKNYYANDRTTRQLRAVREDSFSPA